MARSEDSVRKVAISMGLLALAICLFPPFEAAVQPFNNPTEASSGYQPPEARPFAPDLVLQDLSGQDVALSDFQGQVVLLSFWATWCGPCKAEMPWFSDFQQRYAADGLSVMSVSLDEGGKDLVERFVAERGLTYPVLLGSHQVTETFGDITVIPTTLFIDRQGRIAYRNVGLTSKANLERAIEALLSE